MSRKTKFSGLGALCALTTALACSGSPQMPLSPSAALRTDSALNPDGSSLKISAPTGLSPSGDETLDTRRPTLRFNPAVARFVSSVPGLQYEIEGRDAAGALIYSETISGTSLDLTSDLAFETNFQWRVRARLGADTGPWSTMAGFRTPNRPPTGGGGGGGGPVRGPIPEQCRSGGFACAAAVAAQSAEWPLCLAGIGVGCHRFTRQVANALAFYDQNWTNIMAQPGGHACDCNGCGPSNGAMFREDTVVYGGREVFDMIVGAGGPSPSLNWSGVGGLRPGDLPILAPLCQ
jgi:hypothetical protein